ncbi:MAG: Smr/MutS family protein [Rhodospirillales bacterium]|nr:Smr/MutS family protein [Rhodospirillales bacterium]
MRKTPNPKPASPGGASRQDRRPGAENAAGSLDFGASAPGDAHLWRKVAESARPLRRRHTRVHPLPEVSAEGAGEKTAAPKPTPVPAPKPERKAPPAPPLPTLHPGAAPGVDRNTAASLRKGEMPVEATLDLHGYTQNEAHSALIGAIARARVLGQRCLLVVTGRGGSVDAEGRTTGVLRANVPRWLNESPLRAHVLAFAKAKPRHGGEGALYVLVRRARGARTR